MKKAYYTYNPATDNYERVYPTLKGILWKAFKFLMAGCVIGFFFFLIAFYGFSSPDENTLRKENAQLRAQYNLLDSRLENALKVMTDLQDRDDNFYRVLMQMEPVNELKRMAGVDNEQRYRNIGHMPDSRLIKEVTRQMDILERQIYVQSQSYDQLRETILNFQEKMEHIPSILPVDISQTVVASGFGYMMDPFSMETAFHEGMDFAAPEGAKVMATGGGTVTLSERQALHGNIIEIDHGYNYVSRYSHLGRLLVENGAKVKCGDIIGEVGNTGKSVAPHLHYEVRFKEAPENPVNFFYRDLDPKEYGRLIEIAENAGHMMD